MAIKIAGTTVIDDNRNLVNTQSATFTGSGAIKLPSGTTAEQPATPTEGMLRYNSETSQFEGYTSGVWGAIAGGGGGVSLGRLYFLTGG